jgi:hypothetical protein
MPLALRIFYGRVAQNSSMYTRLSRASRTLPLILGVTTLATVGALLTWDVFPGWFPLNFHAVLGALPLVLISIAYLAYQASHRPSWAELVKAVLLAVAFLLWAANQFWPDLRWATHFNDGAIALFVLDVFLILVGWPSTSPDESFAESPMRCCCNPQHPCPNQVFMDSP